MIEGDPKPIGRVDTPQGGVFALNLGVEPATLNPLTGTDSYAAEIQSYVLDTLMIRSHQTYDWIPALAERAEESADGKHIIVRLRKDAVFHDGNPVTAEDVKFSFDAIFEPKYKAAHYRPRFESIEKAEVLNPQTVKFTVREKYFANFNAIMEMWILPKHFYVDPESGSGKNKTLLGSGPYRLESYDQGQSIVLVRSEKWWGDKVRSMKGKWNFKKIRFRFVNDEGTGIEMMRKGDIDHYRVSPEAYMTKATGAEWGKTVFKVKAENRSAIGYSFIAWNQRRQLFKNPDVRLALSHLLNREELIRKYSFDLLLPTAGPLYRQSDYADPGVKPILFNQKKAIELLKNAGWTDSDKDGVLDKTEDGKKSLFRFTLNYADKDSEKYWVMYQQDLKKIGIELSLQFLEWNAFWKRAKDSDFDAVYMGWGGGSVDWDPKDVWHSNSATPGGFNLVQYSNPEVDKLIEQARQELDKKKRIPILRKVYRLVANDYPYSFLFNRKYTLYLHSNKVGMDKPTYPYGIGIQFWWSSL